MWNIGLDSQGAFVCRLQSSNGFLLFIVSRGVSVCTPRLELYYISITLYVCVCVCCVSLFSQASTSALLGPQRADHSSAGGLHSNLPSFVTICSSWQTKCWPWVPYCLATVTHEISCSPLLMALFRRGVPFLFPWIIWLRMLALGSAQNSFLV